jgi:hypothetical protein
MKMGRRLRCSSVTYRLDMRLLTAGPARTALPAAHFDRNERYAYFGDRTLLSGNSAAKGLVNRIAEPFWRLISLPHLVSEASPLCSFQNRANRDGSPTSCTASLHRSPTVEQKPQTD